MSATEVKNGGAMYQVAGHLECGIRGGNPHLTLDGVRLSSRSRDSYRISIGKGALFSLGASAGDRIDVMMAIMDNHPCLLLSATESGTGFKLRPSSEGLPTKTQCCSFQVSKKRMRHELPALARFFDVGLPVNQPVKEPNWTPGEDGALLIWF